VIEIHLRHKKKNKIIKNRSKTFLMITGKLASVICIRKITFLMVKGKQPFVIFFSEFVFGVFWGKTNVCYVHVFYGQILTRRETPFVKIFMFPFFPQHVC